MAAHAGLDNIAKHKVFISYHHDNDQQYKDELLRLNEQYDIFDDYSVDMGDIDENLNDEAIRQRIRDEHLRDSSVTIILIGAETRKRKHVDWELHSSMTDSKINKRSGIILMELPEAGGFSFIPYEEIKGYYPPGTEWGSVDDDEFRCRHPCLSEKMIVNVRKEDVSIPVVPWTIFGQDQIALKHLIDVVFQSKNGNKYDLRIPMRRHNS